MAESAPTILNSDKMELLPTVFPEDDTAGEQRIVHYLTDRFEAAREFDRPFKLQALEDWRYLNNQLPAGWPFYWQITLPETRLAVQDSMEAMMSSLFPKDDVFDLRGPPGTSDVFKELMREKMKQTLREILYKVNVYLWLNEGVSYGNGLCWTRPRPTIERRRVREMLQIAGVPFGFTEQVVQQLKLKIEMSVVSRFDFFPAPAYCSRKGQLHQMPYCFVREVLPFVEAKSDGKFGAWRNVDKLQGMMTATPSTGGAYIDDEQYEDLYLLLEAAGFDVSTTRAITGSDTIQYVELLHYFENDPGSETCRARATLGNRVTLLKVAENDWGFEHKPLADVRYGTLDPRLWQGYGAVSTIRPYVDSLNIRNAQEAEALEFAIRPQRLVASDDKTLLTKLRPWPGAVVAVPDVNITKLMEMPRAVENFAFGRQEAMAGIQRATRVTDIGRGTPSKASGTAKGADTMGGMQMLMGQQQRAAAFRLLQAEELGIAEQLNQVCSLIQSLMREPEMLQLSGPNQTLERAGVSDSVMLRPEMLAGDYEVYAVGSTKAIEGPQRAMELLAWIEKWRGEPEVWERIKKLVLFEMGSEMLFGSELSRIVMSDEEFTQFKQQQAAEQLKQALAAIQGAGSPQAGFTPTRSGFTPTRSGSGQAGGRGQGGSPSTLLGAGPGGGGGGR